MSVSTSTPTESVPSSGPARHRWLIVGLVAVLALALGFGVGWAVFAPASPIAVTSAEEPAAPPDVVSESTVPAEIVTEIETLLDDFFTAWTAGDTDAVLSLMTPNGSFNLHGCLDAQVADTSGTGAAACVERFSNGSFWRADAALLISDGPPYDVGSLVVAVPTKEGLGADPTSPYFAGSQGLTHFTVTSDDNGQLKIAKYELLY
jgi:hypothetical protein